MTTRTMGICERLREATREAHQYAESRPLERALAAGTLPREVYLAYLGQRLWVHLGLEMCLDKFRGQDLRAAAVVREELYQSPPLRRDLAYWRMDAARMEALPATRRFLDWLEVQHVRPAAWLGAWYVLEGSKNGARYLVRQVRRMYGLAPGQGEQYLDPHGEAQPRLWAQFKSDMNGQAWTEPEVAAMIAGAQETFAMIAAVDEALYAP